MKLIQLHDYGTLAEGGGVLSALLCPIVRVTICISIKTEHPKQGCVDTSHYDLPSFIREPVK